MKIYLENEWIVLSLALVAALVVTGVVKFLLKTLSPRLKSWAARTTIKWDNLLVDAVSETRAWFIFVWLFVPALWAAEKIDETWKTTHVLAQAGRPLLVIACSVQLILWGLLAIREWKNKCLVTKIETANSTPSLLYTSLQALLIVGVVLMAMSNLGVNIGALITGLGIGGIAIALAAQNILGDFLASLSIVLDKPFVTGDYIVVGQEEGEVENIAVKTTRVRSISGEELIFSNKDLLESRVRNFKRMWRRRVAHKIRLDATTPEEKIRQVPNWVREIFPRYPKLKLDRCRLVAFGESSLDFDLVFWVEDTSYTLFVDLQEQLLLDILCRLQREKISLGFPSRLLRFEKSANYVSTDQESWGRLPRNRDDRAHES